MDPGPRVFARVAEIVALYRGHFLAAAGDEPWVLPARERLWDRMRRMLLAFAGAAGRAGESEQALRIYHFIADLDPLAEDAFLALMRHFALLGHKAEALRAYERCAAALAAELGATPGAALQALARELRRKQP
jgi:DNA-binding SARP family transcriptional activator